MAPKIIPLAYCYILALILFARKDADAVIGLNWGRNTAQRLIPSMVVDLLLQNGVKEARIYSSQEDILQAFSGSGIGLTLTIFQIAKITCHEEANDWVQKKVPYFVPANIRRIYLGDQVFKRGLQDMPFLISVINTLEFIQQAINDAGYGHQIKVTFPQPHEVLKANITKPSQAEFRDEIMQEMLKTLQILHQNDAPFVIEIFPISYVADNNWDPSFAFPDNKSTYIVHDINDAVYTNVFEFLHDSFVWALIKAGFPNMKIIVSQVGWPTDGYPGANTTSAELFYKSLLPMVISNKGTPMRPGYPIDTFVHCLTDEHKMPFSQPFARHWGIYRSNGEPKYKIDLSGQGRDIYPTKAKGIMHMPKRWCVLGGNVSDVDKVKYYFDEACSKADCTSLAPGGSCSELTFAQNVSYAFNMYFQAEFQNETACKFDGFGEVVTEDPSTGSCVFPVEVVKGDERILINLVAYGNKLHEMSKCATFVILASVMWLWVLL